MVLFVRDLGGSDSPQNPTLVVLHGLYGSSRNWVSAGRRLAEHFQVLALDLRNHGRSPSADGMSYSAMAGDVIETLDALEREGRAKSPIHLMGHSMGGKAAMRIACDAPERVAHLWVLDIAPKEYRPYRAPLEAMLDLDLASVSRRSDADAQLEGRIEDRALRQFLLTNLVHEGEGFRWQLALQTIAEDFASLGENPLDAGDRYDGPTHFIVSDRSGYFERGDVDAVRRHFPSARVHVMTGVGHDLHVEGGERFVELVTR